jgi:hypothetical protein
MHLPVIALAHMQVLLPKFIQEEWPRQIGDERDSGVVKLLELVNPANRIIRLRLAMR